MLLRGPALPASPGAVSRVLHEAGYTLEEMPTNPHPDKPREFERAKPNQLWQTDLFTFVLKRQNRRVHLVGFMDDHSRFLVGYGLHASQSTALVIEFPTRDDPRVASLLQRKKAGAHPDYDREPFERALADRFDVERAEELAGGTRILYHANPH